MHYLIYSSRKKESCDEQEIQNILDACQRNNSKKNITGILLHSNDRFLQYLEGDQEKIQHLYEHIRKDVRHDMVMLVKKGEVQNRLFPSWEMGYKKLNNSLGFHSDVDQKEISTFNQLLNGQSNSIEEKQVLKTLTRFYILVDSID